MIAKQRWSGSIVTTALTALVLAAMTGCGSADSGSAAGKVTVVAGFYPLQFVAEQVGGDRVSVTNLVPPGAEPHDLELNPRQLAALTDAQLVLYVVGFQPDVDEAVEQGAAEAAFDVTSVVPLLGIPDHEHASADEPAPTPSSASKDPHIWLDPSRLATVADAVVDRLSRADPDGADDYRARATALRAKLTAVDTEFTTGLSSCRTRVIVTSHSAFGYLADRYDLEQIGLTGLSPEVEPTPQRLATVAAEAKEHGATTIFFETLVSPKVADALANEIGARTAVLDPIEGLRPGTPGDYFSVMRANLSTLRTALHCQ